MRDFLFRKDLWILDTASALVFAFYLGYVTAIPSLLSSFSLWKCITAGSITAFCYLITLLLAFNLRQRYTNFSSWAWLGILGGLVQVSILWLGRELPNTIEWQWNFAPSVMSAIAGMGQSILRVGFRWLIWGAAGSAFILGVRLIVFFPRAIWGLASNR
ncbi:MAG TPA: hypothetical protein VGO50_08425 [Pyrinomonadaceae bacterium]|jgi:hypothetical protein|nr:hypothetical protein [Pyrinomonadaceae bacterium]